MPYSWETNRHYVFKDNPNMIVKHHIESYNQFCQTGYT